MTGGEGQRCDVRVCCGDDPVVGWFDHLEVSYLVGVGAKGRGNDDVITCCELVEIMEWLAVRCPVPCDCTVPELAR